MLYKKFIKRAIDVIVSFIGIIVLIPVWLIISIALYVDDPGPVIFTQNRIGKNKKIFKIWKFRSMKMSTPSDVPTHMFKNPDRYITKVGRFLRRTSFA